MQPLLFVTSNRAYHACDIPTTLSVRRRGKYKGEPLVSVGRTPHTTTQAEGKTLLA